MGDFDANIAAAGFWDTDITRKHAPQKKKGGSQLSRDQNKKKEHMRAEKEGGGWVPVKSNHKQWKQGKHEMQ